MLSVATAAGMCAQTDFHRFEIMGVAASVVIIRMRVREPGWSFGRKVSLTRLGTLEGHLRVLGLVSGSVLFGRNAAETNYAN